MCVYNIHVGGALFIALFTHGVCCFVALFSPTTAVIDPASWWVGIAGMDLSRPPFSARARRRGRGRPRARGDGAYTHNSEEEARALVPQNGFTPGAAIGGGGVGHGTLSQAYSALAKCNMRSKTG